MNGWFDQ